VKTGPHPTEEVTTKATRSMAEEGAPLCQLLYLPDELTS
jgi:hypothetical protein